MLYRITLWTFVRMRGSRHKNNNTFLDAAEKGMRNTIIRTLDSNIITIVLGQFELISQKWNDLNITWIRFGKGKYDIVYGIDKTFTNLGPQIITLLPLLDSLTWSDTTSPFHKRTKLVAWEAWKNFLTVTESFLCMINNPFSKSDQKSWQFKIIEVYYCPTWPEKHTWNRNLETSSRNHLWVKISKAYHLHRCTISSRYESCRLDYGEGVASLI